MMKKPHPTLRMDPARYRQGGFSLIEVLLALFVLSIGLLGLAKLQLYSMRQNNSALLRSQANVLALDILDRMRANRDAAVAGAYDINIGTAASGASSCVGSGNNCSGASMAAYDLSDWKANIASLLPSGDGGVSRVGTLVTVTVQWDDSRGAEAALQFTSSADL